MKIGDFFKYQLLGLAIAALPCAPALADEAPKSEAGTAFMEKCLADVTAHRIATLKKQAPEYAASLSDEDLTAGAMQKAQKACPCFLQIIAVNPDQPGTDAEEKVATVVAYLEANSPDSPQKMPLTITRLTRMCGERNSVLPSNWIGK